MRLKSRIAQLFVILLLALLPAACWEFTPARTDLVDRTAEGQIRVKAGADLQAALNAARPGDTLLLEAGAVFVGSFVLPSQPASATSWITIRTAAPDSALPDARTRVTPEHAASLAVIASPGRNEPALGTAAGAHHYRFVGVEFRPVNAQAQVSNLIFLGLENSARQNEGKPHHITLDRCYIHAFPQQELRRGVALNGTHIEVINSYVAGFKARGVDTQALCGWDGPGPFRIINNYLEAAGENVMFGGGTSRTEGLVPSDIELRGNHLAKPRAWRNVWSVKNIFELKNAQRVIVDGNVLEYSWASGQSGMAVLFTPRGEDRAMPWAVVQDVQFTNNIVRHAGGGFNILGRDDTSTTRQTNGILIRNNLLEDISAEWSGGGAPFLLISGVDKVTVDHNTVFHTGNIITAYGERTTNFTFTNNIIPHNEYGIAGDAVGGGILALRHFFPDYTFSNNLIINAQRANARPENLFPPANHFPDSLDRVGFVDYRSGNYRLNSSSSFKTAGGNGKPPGVNLEALNAATSGALRGVSVSRP